MNKLILYSFLICSLFTSCAKSTIDEVEIYSNDFESGELSGITNGNISTFSDTKVLGNYNNEHFDLSITELPEHDLVDITFDLYIHDNWDGNLQLQDNAGGPDIWEMKVDDKTYMSTTFSNNECLPGNFCPPQSYPDDYPNFNHNPKTGAYRTELPGFCIRESDKNGTTLYKVHKSISHSKTTLVLRCLDKLVQKNLEDQKCDESWSVDNIKIKVINLK